MFHPPGVTEIDRKLRVPWLSPYRVEAKKPAVGYTVRNEMDDRVARVHVNHLRNTSENFTVVSQRPEHSLFPDLRGALAKREVSGGIEYQVRRRGRLGFQ